MKNHGLRKSIILSIALHVLLFGGMLLLSLTSEKRRPEQVTVEVISPEEAARLMANTPPPKAIEVPANQIVEQDENVVNEQVPDEKTRFLSAKNQTVKKQTVAVNRGDFQNTKKNSPPAGKTGKETPQSEKAEKPTHDQQVKNLFAAYDPSAMKDREQKAREQEKAGKAGAEGAQGTGDVSRTNDYTKDVDQGLETLLNTREFKYYSYYSRIRRQLAQHWEGKVREKLTKMYREKRAPANLNEDRITKVIVVLNAAGTLVKVQVLSDSGIRDLDDAAVEAFRAAAPFPNPPKGIVESDGTVKIRWDFVLES